MTEAEWLTCTEPEQMLRQLDKASERKLRLFAVACCRRVLRLMLNQRCRAAVEVAERYADGHASRGDLFAASRSTNTGGNMRLLGPRGAAHAVTLTDAQDAASGVAQALTQGFGGVVVAMPSLCDLLRDIFGPDPFRPVEVHPTWFSWHGGVVRQLAQTIYDESRFEDLPVLADALEEAGCTDWDILWHCRSGGDHVRGCWVVDLILAKD